jgi:hypothetical protein
VAVEIEAMTRSGYEQSRTHVFDKTPTPAALLERFTATLLVPTRCGGKSDVTRQRSLSSRAPTASFRRLGKGDAGGD